ncbi:MAG: asparagine--tRNA ligase [Myxococcales bacterium]|jgi:asparaginyl-tRNA synthetase|nr:asparagine--tRNA ligase [Myxococcales bacterium]MBL0197844.1 asparagine--tRNA ligase [Myxococcales bacterium]HQY64523.1 asparagine--tRNA ligase [Polyangiaceae bacterium]
MVSVDDVLKGRQGADVGERVTVGGWVRTRRDSKAGLSFVALNDGSCFDNLQLVARTELENYADVLRLTSGCSIEATGVVKASEGKGQRVELDVTSLSVVGWVADPDTYPISQKRHSFEYLREVAHLRPRTNTFGAVARVRHALSLAIHRFFHERGYYWVHTPIITASDCEGAGQMFRVSTLDFLHADPAQRARLDAADDFFGREAYLTVSGQLNVETYAMALSKVYTFGPTFRAENSNTARHLAEFWMVEPEIAFCDLAGLAGVAEEFLKFVVETALVERADDMKFFDERIQPGLLSRLRHVVDSPFKRIDYTEAVEVLTRSGKTWEFPVTWGGDLQTEHERYLTEEVFKLPVVVMNYPKDIKSFYMRQNDDGRTVAALDVLAAGIGEIIGGSQREERLDRLDGRIDELKLEKDTYGWYRDLRRYGTVPHAGFGLGFERLVMFVTGMANIRDVIPFPRTPKSATF